MWVRCMLEKWKLEAFLAYAAAIRAVHINLSLHDVLLSNDFVLTVSFMYFPRQASKPCSPAYLTS